jgi:endonuclease YncB( thermonuclease family)
VTWEEAMRSELVKRGLQHRGLVRKLLIVLLFGAIAPVHGAEVTDGDTMLLKDRIYRLAGIDAPQTDQVCLDENGNAWACGIEVRDQLKTFISTRDVQCIGNKPDPAYRDRSIAICRVEGEPASLNQWLVQQGWALIFGPPGKAFQADQEEARRNHRGLWKGCFATPRALRNADKSDAILLGAACPPDQKKALEVLAPVHPPMPEDCSIKGKFALRAHFTGHRGIYHMEACSSYQRVKVPDRWFCSELEAKAEGYRAPFTCRSRRK